MHDPRPQSAPSPPISSKAPSCTVEELSSLVANMIEDVSDEELPRYKVKLFNFFVNSSIRSIRSPGTSILSKCVVLISMHRLVDHIGEDKDIKPQVASKAFQSIRTELFEYVSSKEIVRIRSVILDLVRKSYTADASYRAEPEEWMVKAEEEIGALIRLSPHPVALALARQVSVLFLREIKEIFISRNLSLGSSANLLLISVLHFAQFVKPHMDVEEEISATLRDIQSKFREKSQVESTEKLKELLKR